MVIVTKYHYKVLESFETDSSNRGKKVKLFLNDQHYNGRVEKEVNDANKGTEAAIIIHLLRLVYFGHSTITITIAIFFQNS